MTFYRSTHTIEPNSTVYDASTVAALEKQVAGLKRGVEQLAGKLKVANSRLRAAERAAVARAADFTTLDRESRARLVCMAREPWAIISKMQDEMRYAREVGNRGAYHRKQAKEAKVALGQAHARIAELEAEVKEMCAKQKRAQAVAQRCDAARDASLEKSALVAGVRAELKFQRRLLTAKENESEGLAAQLKTAQEEAEEARSEHEATQTALRDSRARHEKLEAALRAECDAHVEAHRQLVLALRAKQAPAVGRTTMDWDGLEEAAQYKARSRDISHLVSVLEEKEYRAQEVASALDRVGLIGDLFETEEFCDARTKWLYELRKHMHNDSWGARVALHLKCDLLLSERKMDRVRNLLTKDWQPETENYAPRPWWTNPHTGVVVPYPEPLVSRSKWLPAWHELKVRFNLTTNEDGSVVNANFSEAFDRMLRRDLSRMPPLNSFTKDWPMRPCFQFDGTGLWKWALCHGGLKNGSYNNRVSQHSERLLETLFVAHAGDGHSSMLNIIGEWAPDREGKVDANCLAAQMQKVVDSGEYTFEGVTFPCELVVAADLKGVESFRGSGHCSPWCWCSDDQKHAVPFGGDLAKIDATDFYAAAAEAKRLCKYPVSNTMASSMGHVAGAGGGLPPPCPSKLCPCHGKAPYANKVAWEAADTAWAKEAKEAKTPSEKAALARKRTDITRKHGHQKRGEKFLLGLPTMARVPVELLHLLLLNLPKVGFKWLIRRHLSFNSREEASAYFASIGCGIDLKTKEEGRRAEEKWFSGSDWQRVVEGTDKHGGLADAITFLVGLMGEDLKRLPDAEQRRRASARERRRAAGESMDETEALIHDTWGEETGSPMLVALRFFDAYFELYCALNEPWHGDEADQGVREARALRVFKAAVKCGKYMEAGGTNHKSWTPHISMWILFRHVARYGDLWRFSSGALEQRGAQLKRIGSCVACFRPRRAAKGKTAKGKNVSAHNSSAQLNMFQINNSRQELACDPESERFGCRANKALITGLAGGQSGRLTKASNKTVSRLEALCEGGGGSSTDAYIKKGV